MGDRAPHLERFISAVHRRMVVMRFIERVGVSVLGGCGVLALLMPVLIWRHQPTGSLVLATLAVACVAGLSWALIGRPTPLAAAMEADRQLRLAELLSTALSMRGGDDDPFARVVLASAEARCAGASPSSVILNRLGARSWGGIGLALLLVGVVAVMTSESPRTQLSAAAPRTWQELEDQRLADQVSRAAPTARTPDYRRPKTGSGGDENDPIKSGTPTATDTTTTAAKTTANDNKTGASDEGTGAGAGTSASTAKTGTTIKPVTGGTAASTQGQTTSTGGDSTTAASGGTGAGASGQGTAPRRPAPAWQSTDWPQIQSQARQAVSEGRVPAPYQDLVRDYFQRD